MFDLKGYTPQKMTDGFEPFKGKFTCSVNYGRIEVYSGDDLELQGKESFRYELEVLNDANFTGRRLWANFNLDDEKKTKKLRDIMFTLGVDFTNKEELETAALKFTAMLLSVKAWYFSSKENPDEKIQMHQILGEAKEGTTSSEPAPF
jgi:hypothetical protein